MTAKELSPKYKIRVQQLKLKYEPTKQKGDEGKANSYHKISTDKCRRNNETLRATTWYTTDY